MFETPVTKLFSEADIQVNGSRPWDIRVHNPALFTKIALFGPSGLGDAYVDGWWDCAEMDTFFYKLLDARINEKARFTLNNYLTYFREKIFNLQSKTRAFIVGREHYDLGNDLYEAMLDKRMVYTCGYWKDAHDLDSAQEAKLHLTCKKIGLTKGDRVLDIGCGWGSFAKFAAEEYGAEVVGITVSEEQAELARKRCAGLPVEIRVQDYRDVNETFDHIVSLGMFEHVGYKNYRTYMEVVHRCLKDDGFFLLHTMGQRDSYPNTHQPEAHWVIKHIFPNGMLPSPAQIGRATERLLTIEDWHTFGHDYDTTMMAWWKNFDTAWPTLRAKYGDRFYRMWKYYLMIFCGAWRAHNQYNLWQIVLTKKPVPGGYRSIR